MKRIIVGLFFLFGALCVAQAQNTLVLKNGNREVVLIEQAKLIVELNQGNKIKGRLDILSEDQVLIGLDTVHVADIQNIKINRRAQKILGGSVVGVGGLTFLYGVTMILLSGSVAEYAPLYVLAGISLGVLSIPITIGGVLILKAGNHRSPTWKYVVSVRGNVNME